MQSKIDLVGGSNPIPLPHSSHPKSPTTPPRAMARGSAKSKMQEVPKEGGGRGEEEKRKRPTTIEVVVAKVVAIS